MTLDSPRRTRVRKYLGDNGITILQQDNPTSRAFCMGVWINTGSRDERPGEEGLSHFLEHMIFKGTRSRSAYSISQAIEKVGGALEAFTTKEQICVYAQVLNDHRELAADILSDMILNATFPDDQIPLERQVVLEEISDVMDAPDDLIHDLFASEVFREHPLGRPILGSPDSVSRFDRKALFRYAKRHIRAENVVVAVFGTVKKAELMRLCGWAFTLPPRAPKKSNGRIHKFEPVRRYHRRRLHHQHLCIGVRSCSYLDDERYPLMVLTTLLGGTMSSRLFQRIREELGYTYSIYTYADSARDTGLVGTYMSVKPSNTGRVLREVFREFAKVTNGGVTRQEMEDTKEHLKGRILLGLETSSAKMMRMARNEIYFKRQISERELIESIDRVALDDILRLAHKTLDADNNTIVSLGPSSAGLRGATG